MGVATEFTVDAMVSGAQRISATRSEGMVSDLIDGVTVLYECSMVENSFRFLGMRGEL